MSQLPTTTPNKYELALIQGDLSKMTSEEKVNYYNLVCHSVGLNPLTKPFEYMRLNGKEVLYANKNACEQLRQIHKISISITSRNKVDDICVVTAKAKIGDREDESIGAVSTAGLKGEALANALMKTETKAKRRVTLSICSLGMLDETEVETIKDAVKIEGPKPSDPKKKEIDETIIETQKIKEQQEKEKQDFEKALLADRDLRIKLYKQLEVLCKKQNQNVVTYINSKYPNDGGPTKLSANKYNYLIKELSGEENGI